jgi:hypothetical protein
MDCRKAGGLLIAFHDGELPEADRAGVESHLCACPRCAALLADLARADGAAGVPDPGPEYWDRFNGRVAERIDREPARAGAPVLRPRHGWLRQQWRYLVPAVAAAALVVVVVRHAGVERAASPVPPPAATFAPGASEESGRSILPSQEQLRSPAGPAASSGPPAALGPEAPRFPAAGPRTSPAPPARRIGVPAAGSVPAEPGASKEAIAVPPPSPPAPPPSPAGSTSGTAKPAPAPPPVLAAAERAAGIAVREDRSFRDDLGAIAQERAVALPPASATRRAAVPPAAPGAESAADFRRSPGKDEAVPAEKAWKERGRSGKSAADARSPEGRSPCDLARELAGRGRFAEAEAAQRACLASDPTPATQDPGLVFLAELLDRQSRFAEADEVLESTERRFPRSRPLELYRQQRPQLQRLYPPAGR